MAHPRSSKRFTANKTPLPAGLQIKRLSNAAESHECPVIGKLSAGHECPNIGDACPDQFLSREIASLRYEAFKTLLAVLIIQWVSRLSYSVLGYL